MVHAFSFRLEILTEMNNTVVTVYTETIKVCRVIYQAFTFKAVKLHLLRILMITMQSDYNQHFSMWVKHKTLENFQSLSSLPLKSPPSIPLPTLPLTLFLFPAGVLKFSGLLVIMCKSQGQFSS